jgi:hypothetical protein
MLTPGHLQAAEDKEQVIKDLQGKAFGSSASLNVVGEPAFITLRPPVKRDMVNTTTVTRKWGPTYDNLANQRSPQPGNSWTMHGRVVGMASMPIRLMYRRR